MSKLIVTTSVIAKPWAVEPLVYASTVLTPEIAAIFPIIGTNRYQLDLAHYQATPAYQLADYLATMGLGIEDYDAELDNWLDDYEPTSGDITARH